jgi:hypothetical protein
LPDLRSGDVVLQTSTSPQSRAIQLATGSPYSHVGIVEVAPRGTYVIEAIGRVSRTPWTAWRARGEGGRVTILRPRGVDHRKISRVLSQARAFLGKPYDARFGWSDERIYCSELVYKAYLRGAGLRAGRLQKVRELELGAIQKQVMERYGRIPWELELVTPASIAESSDFTEIYSDF